MRPMKRSFVVAPLLLALACGYSEEEWQAQLAKYEALSQQNRKLKRSSKRSAAA
jgi:hypothetical protein